MSLHKLFKSNPQLERDGITIDLGPNEDLPADNEGKRPHIQFRIARAGGSNQNYNKTMERLTRPYRRAIQSGHFSNEQAETVFREAFISTVLLGWNNVTDEKGQVLPFSAENANKLFSAMPDLLNFLREEASNASLFREELRETDLGNSGRSLSTASSKDQ